jgi:hypothetical protein
MFEAGFFAVSSPLTKTWIRLRFTSCFLSDITMPGDDAGMEMQATTSHVATAGGMSVGGRPPKKKKLQPSKARAARRLAPRGTLKK